MLFIMKLSAPSMIDGRSSGENLTVLSLMIREAMPWVNDHMAKAATSRSAFGRYPASIQALMFSFRNS